MFSCYPVDILESVYKLGRTEQDPEFGVLCQQECFRRSLKYYKEKYPDKDVKELIDMIIVRDR